MAETISTTFDANLNPLRKALADAQSAIEGFAARSPQGVRKLDNAFKDLSLQSFGATGNIARLGDALLEFVPGGLITAGVVAGIGGIVMITKHYEQQQKEAKESSDNLRDALEDQRLAYVRLKDGVDAYNQALLDANITKATTRLQEARTAVSDLNKEIEDQAATQLQFSEFGAAGGRIITEQDKITAGQRARAGRQTELNKLLEEEAKANKELLDALSAKGEAYQDAQRKASESVRKTIEQIAKERRAYEEAALAQRKLFEQIRESALKQFEEQAKQEAERIAGLRKAISDELQKGLMTDDQLQESIQQSLRGVQLVTPEIQKIIDKQKEQYTNLQLFAQAASEGWQMMFEVIGKGGSAFAQLGQGFARLVSGLAKTKAAENIAFAVENLAKALGLIALGNVPSAAAAKASAAGHFKAAALWGALGGVAANAAGGAQGPGGIGGGGMFNNSQVGRNNFGGQQEPLTIVIQGGLLDMSNPDTVRSFTSALETVSSRRITINRVGA